MNDDQLKRAVMTELNDKIKSIQEKVNRERGGNVLRFSILMALSIEEAVNTTVKYTNQRCQEEHGHPVTEAKA